MVGAFTSYTGKPRRVEIFRGYCYRFFQCSFPCGIIMLILSILFIIVSGIQLIYIFYFNGCNTLTTSDSDSNIDNDLSISSSSLFNCNRQTMKVLGITFAVTGFVLLLISILIIKYSRSSEENNVIRATASSFSTNNTQNQHHHHHPPSTHYYRTPSSSINDQTNMVVSI